MGSSPILLEKLFWALSTLMPKLSFLTSAPLPKVLSLIPLSAFAPQN